MKNRSIISHLQTATAICLFTTFLTAKTFAQSDVITFDVGQFSITLLSEGQRQGNASSLIGATSSMLKQTVPNGVYPNAVNAFLVKTANKTVLFDTGYGRKLFDGLKTCGKTADEIDAVILTHMHGDHIGGLLRGDGQKSFPKAVLYIPKLEHDYWMSNEAMQTAPENKRGSFAAARKVIEAYSNSLNIFIPAGADKKQELLPGISTVAIYGHTPGHTGYLLQSDGAQMFIWGDLTHAMAIQIPYPEVAVTADVDPTAAVESRKQILQWLEGSKIRIAGMHIPYPAIGDIKKNKAGEYTFVPVCECEGR